MLSAPRADLSPNTLDYEITPLVKATGFREYDARWLLGSEINLMGVQALGMGLGTLIRGRWREGLVATQASDRFRLGLLGRDLNETCDLANLEQGIGQLKANQEQIARDNAKATEELKASQEQMTRLIAKLSEHSKIAEPNLRLRTSVLPAAPSAAPRPVPACWPCRRSSSGSCPGGAAPTCSRVSSARSGRSR